MHIEQEARRRQPEAGQGLAEYALILVLVAVTVIGITAVMGESVVEVYCKIVNTIQPDMETTMCERLKLSCTGDREAVFDSASLPEGDQIDRVEFKVDGAVVKTERQVSYCLTGGDSGCNGFDHAEASSVPDGSHQVTATIYSENGLTGTCSFSYTK